MKFRAWFSNCFAKRTEQRKSLVGLRCSRRRLARSAEICRRLRVAMLDGRGNARLRACRLDRDLAGRSCVTRLSSGDWRGRRGTWDGHERWGRNLRDGRSDGGLLCRQSVTSPPDGRGSNCDENNGDCRGLHQRKRTTFPAPLQLAPERRGALESRCFTLESAQILELSTAGQAGVQMSAAMVQPGRREPATDVRFQILIGRDGSSTAATSQRLI